MTEHELVALHDTPEGLVFECSCGHRGLPLHDVVTKSGVVVYGAEEWARGSHETHVAKTRYEAWLAEDDGKIRVAPR